MSTAPWMASLLVFMGGGLGAALRHHTNSAAALLFGTGFPYGTLIVNAAGSAVMGLLAGWLHVRFPSEVWGAGPRLFLMAGVLGGYTTFSAFSLDAVALWERGATGLAVVYVVASVLLSIGALILGLALARAVVSG